MNSWTNLVVRHGYPSEQQDYQYPNIEMENISSNCGEDIGQIKTDEDDGTKHGEFRNTSGYQKPTTCFVHVSNESIQFSSALKESSFEDKNEETSASDYRHPKLDNTYTDMSMQKNVNVPSKFKDTSTMDQVKDRDKNSTLSNHQHPTHMCSNTVVEEIHPMSESEATSSDYNNSTSVDSLNQDIVATDFGESSLTDQVNNVTEASKPGNYQHSNPHQTCSTDQKENTQNPELPPRSRTFPKTQPAIHVTSDKTSPVAPLKPPRYSKPSRSLLPRKNIKTPIKSDEETLTKNRPAIQHPVTSCSKTATPEIDINYSEENKAVPNLTKETVSPITLTLADINSQAPLSKPQLDGITSQGKSLAVEKCTKASEESRDNTTSIFTDLSKYQTSSTLEKETKRNSDYHLPVIDKKFLETEGTSGENDSITTDEGVRSSFEKPSSIRAEQNRESKYQIPDIDIKFFQTEHKALNPPTSCLPERQQKSSFTRASMPPVSSEPPTLPLTESLQRSLSATEFLPPYTSRPPPLPSKKPSLKSSKIVSSLPPIPPKKTPKLPAKAKLVSPKTSSAFYTELNQLDRVDDAANYGHLHSMTKQ